MIYFITFANHAMDWTRDRLRDQALASGWFDTVWAWSEDDLDSEFYTTYRDFMESSKGYGWYVWKPQVIVQALSKLNEGDILVYADAGCSLNSRAHPRWAYYIDLLTRQDGTMISFITPSLPECQWTKGDVLDYFNVRNSPTITQTGQYMATYFFIKKTSTSVQVMDEWSRASRCLDLITNDPSVSSDLPGFKENRYDQSLFSIIRKLHPMKYVFDVEPLPWDHEPINPTRIRKFEK